MTKEEILSAIGYNRNPSVTHIMQYFEYAHLPQTLGAYSKLCCDLAIKMCQELDDSPELAVALRKLLEAKDAFVRAAL